MFELTFEVAESFFKEHMDDTLVSLWRDESKEDLGDGFLVTAGSDCPLGVVLNVAGKIDQPGVCGRYWSADYPLCKDRHEIDPVLSRFVRLVDSSGTLWSRVTGRLALDLLYKAARDVAEGRA